MGFPSALLEFHWLEQAQAIEQRLQNSTVSVSDRAETLQQLGGVYDLASRQSDSIEEFRGLRQRAVDVFLEASDCFRTCSDEIAEGKRLECLAEAEYLCSWMCISSSEKSTVLYRCRDFATAALKQFSRTERKLDYGRASNLLSSCLHELMYVVSNSTEMVEVVCQGFETSKKAVSALSLVADKEQLVLALAWESIHAYYISNISDQYDSTVPEGKCCIDCSERALKLSRQIGNPYLLATSLWTTSLSTAFFTKHIELSLEYAKEMLNQASVVRDNYLRGVACHLIAQVSSWAVPREADPDKRKKTYDEIIKYSAEALEHLSFLGPNTYSVEACCFSAEANSGLALDFSVDLKEKLSYCQKAVEAAETGLKWARESDSIDAIGTGLHALSKAYYFYSNLKTINDEKKELLKSSLALRNEYINAYSVAYAKNSWLTGLGRLYAGQIEAELSRVATDEKSSFALLQDAISTMDEGITFCRRWLQLHDVPTQLAVVAKFQSVLGNLLEQAYVSTKNDAFLVHANEAHDTASEDFKKVNLSGRVAESNWRIAKNLDSTNDFQGSSKRFEEASSWYAKAADQLSQFSDFYLEYVTYMRAWSRIEDAKHAHNKEQYEQAAHCYREASQLLNRSARWSYLSSNFVAWSLLEEAEDLSRRENSQTSIETFRNTILSFAASKKRLIAQLQTTDKQDERELIERLVDVLDTRIEHCKGRVEIEEAKVLDKQGSSLASSSKYDRAAEIFQSIAETSNNEVRKDARVMAYLCQAWQRMMLAEARNSPALYGKAAELFKLASENATPESLSLLALGHSSFCEALEAGARYESTRDQKTYDQTSRYMSSAANYYLKAGFSPASDFAKATQRLFDVYVYMDGAHRESDPLEQARYYEAAERLLQSSAQIYSRGGYTWKNEQVQRLIRKVKEEKEFALSLSDIFHAPLVTSSTKSFSALSPVEETAVGLERFENADIQAKINVAKEANVGENVDFEVKIVNVGKEPVSLVAIEGLIPINFQLVSKPDYCQLDDSRLSMRGKRFDPLKEDSLKFVLSPFSRGEVSVKPRIVCVDRIGKLLPYDLEPAVLKVSPLINPERLMTGFEELDDLLLGGLPLGNAMILMCTLTDFRDQIMQKYLETGIKNGEPAYFVTSEPKSVCSMAKNFTSIFRLFVCHPRANSIIADAPNICKLRGVENLTELDIALTKAFRTLEPKATSRRIGIALLSDVLLQHHAMITRKWLANLLTDLKSHGFTTLAVLNPQMHPQQEVQAILDLFDGEVTIVEKEAVKGLARTLSVRRLNNQQYLPNEVALNW